MRQTYTIDETAEILGVSRSSAYAAAKAGQIPAIRIGRRLVIPKVALDKLLNIADVNGTEDPACP